MSIYDFDFETLDLCDDISGVNVKDYYIKFKDQTVLSLPSVISNITRYHKPNFQFRLQDTEYFDHSHQIIDFFKSIDIILNSRPIRNKIFDIMSKHIKMSKYFTFLDYKFNPSYSDASFTTYDENHQPTTKSFKDYSFKINDNLIIRRINSKGEIKELTQDYYIPDNVKINYTIRLDGIIVDEYGYHGVYRIVGIDYYSDEEPIQKIKFNNAEGYGYADFD